METDKIEEKLLKAERDRCLREILGYVLSSIKFIEEKIPKGNERSYRYYELANMRDLIYGKLQELEK